jgi:hypothetical protein
VPAVGADVIIPAGKTVLLDTNVQLGVLNIQGELLFEEKALSLSAKEIYVSGTWRLGTPESPRVSSATITLTGARPADGSSGGMAGNRTIHVMGGTLAGMPSHPPSPGQCSITIWQ